MRKVKEKEESEKWPMITDRSSQQPKQRFVSTWPQIWSKSVEISVDCQNASTPLIVPPPTPYPPMSIIFVLFWIMFYVIVNKENNLSEILNESENEFELELDLECELECKNVNCYFYDCDDLCNGYCPTPRPPIVDFINIGYGISGIVAFKCIFNIDCNKNRFVCGENIIVNDINNENFYNTECFYPTPHLAHAPASTPTTIMFNGIDKGLCENDILKAVFEIGLCKNKYDNQIICNDTFDIYFSKNFSSWFSLSLCSWTT